MQSYNNLMKINKKVAFFIIFILIIIGAIFLLLTRKQVPFVPRESGETWGVKIIDGDIYKVYASKESELLISTTDIKDEIIKSFIFVELSPDRSKMCFVAQSMVPQWLYYSNADGSGITQIGLGKNCTWSNNSKKVAYNNHTTDVSPVNVLVYDLLLKKTTNYTAGVQSADLLRAYKMPVWSPDDNTITSEFSSLTSGTGATGKGVSTIDLKSGEVSDE